MSRATAASAKKKTPRFPTHIAIIMDGNGRWAQKRGLPRLEGHKAGVENLRSAISYLGRLKLKYPLRILHRKLEAPQGRD
jgi:undecaprenyl pyrophosphate synthase